jgi:hypothetical protein
MTTLILINTDQFRLAAANAGGDPLFNHPHDGR